MPKAKSKPITSRNTERFRSRMYYAGVEARLKLIAEALELPPQNWAALAKSTRGLLTFCYDHGQSFDWVIMDDLRPMIRTMYRRPPTREDFRKPKS